MQIEIDYTPRPQQQEFHDCDARFRVLVWHRRIGKTVGVVNELIKLLCEADSFMPTVAYICPLRNQAKRIAWPMVKHFMADFPGVKFDSQDLTVHWMDRRFFVLGSDNPDAIRGSGLDAAAFDETAQIDPYTWSQVVRPALAERNGRGIFIGTPKGRMNLFHELWEKAAELPDWWRSMQRASETGILTEDELRSLRREMSSNEFDQEFECSFVAAVTGAYYAKEMAEVEEAGRITAVAYDKRYPVFGAMDLGWSDLTVCWYFQLVGNQVWVLRCDAWHHTSLPDVLDDMAKLPFPIHQLLVPHDIKVTELGSGTSRLEVLWSKGANPFVVPRHSIEDGREAVRDLLPRCAFDRDGCKTGIEGLVQYRTEYDSLLKVYGRKHVHDWCSHYADAFRYLAVGREFCDTAETVHHEPQRYRAVI